MGDSDRMKEIAEYVQRDLATRDGPVPQVHIHYHAAPVEPPAPLPAQSRGEVVLINAVPYFVILLGGVVILAAVGVITVLLVPALMALAVTVAVVMCGFAVCLAAAAAAVRSLRQSKTEAAASRELLKRSRKR